MNGRRILNLELKGGRFDGHSVPLELLSDLAALEPILFEIVEWRASQAVSSRGGPHHQSMRRVPLRLCALGRGDPALHLCIFWDHEDGKAMKQVFDGCDDVVKAIEAAQEEGRVADDLPLRTLGAIARLGRSLREDETIVFETVDGRPSVRLTKEVSRRLALESLRAQVGDEAFAVDDLVFEVDQLEQDDEPMVFDRITSDPGRLGGRPCIRGLRISVQRIVEAAAIYPDRDELLREYPDLEAEDVRQALLFAAVSMDAKVAPSPAAP
ncbi:MAG: DUF433 domain-containing protein [Paludisphaera borealis]|uniref:DUF433 domain-containing protein n=1 Tax=Paludisphaera borealis TaxID=1387353 RepID=UPI00283E073E|nr:DUF433 domain-containing protein [Paludisphaera borealis]MDR3619687.1 DUF433 domain-containing protein [Paludisphaera borealis]